MIRWFVFLALGALARGATVTVTPQGPIASLAAARDAIRALRARGDHSAATVVIRGGVYRLEDTFVLAPQDSDVTYAAAAGERPIVSGGRAITGWKKGSGPIWSAPAPFRFRQLFVNGRRAVRARTPNSGFYRIDGPSSQDKPFTLKFRGAEIKPEWAGRDVEVVALLAWAELRMPIAQVDAAAHTARFAANPQPSNRETDARYWIENAPDGLDSPGEWRLDSATGVVSYWPDAGEDLTRDEVVAPAMTQLVRIEGKPESGAMVRNVVFRGLDFRHADWVMGPAGYAEMQAAMSAPSAFEAVGAEGVVVDHCVFTQSGGYAVWFGRGCRRNRITANEMFDLGGGGVKIGETVTRTNEAERNVEHTVSDNEIHDLGLVYPSANGIWIGQSSRNTISHNHVHDLYEIAISVGWTWGYGPNQCAGNTIEFNHLDHIGKEMMSDMGGVYTLGVQPGTVIRNNLIHDVRSFDYGGWGIYPDEGSSDLTIENNIVYRTKSAGFHQHYGQNNLVRNNIFAFGEEFQLMRTRAEDHVQFTFEGNIVYFDSGGLLGNNWTGDQFQMNRNIYWDARGRPVTFAGSSLAEWRARGHDVDSLVADPLFANAANYDFTLLPNSPAWKLGWKKIDMSGVGPREIPGIPGAR